jgi:hypothetical protein
VALQVSAVGTDTHFHPSLIFAGKVGAYKVGLCRLLALAANLEYAVEVINEKCITYNAVA